MCGSDIFLGVIAILFPPLAVWVKRGICSCDSLINIALCCLGFLPGLVHAWYIISIYPDPTYEQVDQEPEGGRVTYYYVQQNHRPSVSSSIRPGYGTINGAPSNGQFPGQQQGSTPPKQHHQDQQQPKQYHQDQQQPSASAAGPSNPPSYAEAVNGDNKVQTHN